MKIEDKLISLYEKRYEEGSDVKQRIKERPISIRQALAIVEATNGNSTKAVYKYNWADYAYASEESTFSMNSEVRLLDFSDETKEILLDHGIVLLKTLFKFINAGGTPFTLGITDTNDVLNIIDLYRCAGGYECSTTADYYTDINKTQILKEDRIKLVSIGETVEAANLLVQCYRNGSLNQDLTMKKLYEDISIKLLARHLSIIGELKLPEELVSFSDTIMTSKYNYLTAICVALKFVKGYTIKSISETTGYSSSKVSAVLKEFINGTTNIVNVVA